ncbi:MAG: acyl carrier protein [Desulfobacterales bacterium]|nr:acyl carrier protein [Desulfobacterales bacterium]MBF0395549.1 acyl carrier protein [Desulfobacterales bacterium]
MTEKEIVAIINKVLCDEFELDLDKMKPEALIYEDLGLDSLDRVDMVIVLEGVFNFKIREEESIRKIRTLGEIHKFVISKITMILC